MTGNNKQQHNDNMTGNNKQQHNDNVTGNNKQQHNDNMTGNNKQQHLVTHSMYSFLFFCVTAMFLPLGFRSTCTT